MRRPLSPARRAGLIGLAICAACSWGWASAAALEPPTAAQLRTYAHNGTLAARVAAAGAIGNQRMSPRLAQRLDRALAAISGSPIQTTSVPPLPWPTDMPSTGTVRALALLIDFPDEPHPVGVTPAAAQSGLFGDGISSMYPLESLRAFYARSSYGKLDIPGDVLGWYRSATDRADIPKTDEGRDALIAAALQGYDAAGHDFSQYDADGDGAIDELMVFYSGPTGPWADFWWGYLTDWTGPAIELDGKTIATYSWQWVDDPFSPHVAIHETGHALGLPDYYDYDTTVGPGGGVGGLDVMDGHIHDHNCFSKWLLGWLVPTPVTSGIRTVTLRPSGTTTDALLLMPEASADDPYRELFLVQNREPLANDDTLGHDATDKWHGLLIWHVDARLDAMSGYFAYDNSYTDHKLLRLMEADGLEEIESTPREVKRYTAEQGDYYRDGAGFGPMTFPGSAAYGGTASAIGVGSITSSGGDYTLTCGVGAPGVWAPTTTATGLPAGWSAADVAVTLSGGDSVYGVAAVQYRLGAGDWSAYEHPIAIGQEGETALAYRSIDVLGNVEATREATVRIDKTAPAATLVGHAATGWVDHDVKLTLQAGDDSSGVAKIEYQLGAGAWTTYGAPVVVSTEGETLFGYRAVDSAGNTEAAKTATVRIDKTGPVTTATNKLSVKKNRKATFRFKVADRTATAKVTIKIYKGKKLKKSLVVGSKPCGSPQSYSWKKCTLAKGTYTWKVYATDEAGNAQVKIGSKQLTVK